jgi:hypothetical protein
MSVMPEDPGNGVYGRSGIIHKALAAKASGSYSAVLGIDCGRLAVGYPSGDSVSPVVVGAGVVEIYSAFSGTNFRFMVDNPITANGTEFGTALALDGPYLLVGAPVYDPAIPGAASGAAFHFRDRILVKTWFGQSAGDFFGQAVAIERDRVAIGAPRRAGTSGGTPFDDLGAVYIYERNKGGAENWGIAKVLVPVPVSPSPSPLFGSAVALSGDSIAIGSPFETSVVIPGPAGACFR